MTIAEIGIRALVAPVHAPPKNPRKPSGRIARYGKRVLVFDTETTVDFRQSLLFAFFLLVVDGRIELEGAIVPEWVPTDKREIITAKLADERHPILTPRWFIDDVFYPEVWSLGTLCVTFNAPWDLSRLSIHAACGRGEYRKAFTLTMTPWFSLPRIRIETISSKAAFIQFVPASEKGSRIFPGRFLDLKTLTAVFTGRSHSLKSACDEFKTDPRKTGLDEYGVITPESVRYGRNDVHATYALYERLVAEYSLYEFATFENEFDQAR